MSLIRQQKAECVKVRDNSVHQARYKEVQVTTEEKSVLEGRKCFILQCTQHNLFIVILCQTYGKGPLR